MDNRIGWVALTLAALAMLLLLPMAAPIVLALWAAELWRPFHRRVARALGGRQGIAGILTVTLTILISVPFIIVFASVATDAYALVVSLLESPKGEDLVGDLVKNGGGEAGGSPWEMLLAQREQAWAIINQVAGTAAAAAIGLFVFIAGMYGFLVEGPGWYMWLRDHAPIPPHAIDRLAGAFHETGRGLFFGIGGAGLVQAIVATVAFLILGVPHAFALGLLVLVASVFPAIGGALVWVPVAVGLAVTGRTTAAIVMAAIGIFVISSVDNLIKPLLARRAKLQLPSFVVIVSMFGGVAAMGGWGLLFAPLAMRLAKEALALRRESVVADRLEQSAG